MAIKQVNDFSPEERQHILEQLKGGMKLQEVAMINGTSWQAIRAIQRIAEGDMGQRKTTPEERERIWKRAGEVGFAQAAAENHLSENTILNWQWRYNMPDLPGEEDNKPAYNKVYTPEEKAEILAFAQKVGVGDAARKFHVSTTSIRNWTKQQLQGQLPSLPRQEQDTLTHHEEAEHEEQQPVSHSTESEQPVQEPIQQPSSSLQAQDEMQDAIADKTANKAAEKPIQDEVLQSEPAIEALLPADPRVRALVARVQELSAEVAILKERNAVLTRRVEALKASVMNLL